MGAVSINMPEGPGLSILFVFGGFFLTLVGLFTSKGKTKQKFVSQSVEQTESTQVKQIRCKNCNSLIPENEKYCGQCGYNMSEIKKPELNFYHWLYMGYLMFYSGLFGGLAQFAKIPILPMVFGTFTIIAPILFFIFAYARKRGVL
jgi:hypothetical protein